MNTLIAWAARGLIRAADLEVLGTASGLLPDRRRWLLATERLLLAAGALLLAAGVVFFVAANWSGMSRFSRFALAQALVVAPALLYWRWPDQPAGRAALGFGILAIGALLALYGQTYQTGADPWQLFAAWALLALPWVWLVRSSLVWLGWLLLLDLALWRWLGLHAGGWGWLVDVEWQAWSLFLVHGLALLAVHHWGERGFEPGRPAWVRNLLYLLTLGAITVLALSGVFGDTRSGPLALLVWAVTLCLAWYAWRVRSVNIAALAASVLSGIVVCTAVLARLLHRLDDFGIWLLIALAIIAMTGISGRWLLRLSREQPR